MSMAEADAAGMADTEGGTALGAGMGPVAGMAAAGAVAAVAEVVAAVADTGGNAIRRRALEP